MTTGGYSVPGLNLKIPSAKNFKKVEPDEQLILYSDAAKPVKSPTTLVPMQRLNKKGS